MPIQQFFNKLIATATDTVKNGNNIPSEYLDHQEVNKHTMRASKTILNVITGIQQYCMENEASQLVNELDDPAEQYDSTVDILDQMLENVDMALDEYDHQPSDTTSLFTTGPQTPVSKALSQKGASLLRPQAKWTDVDNSNSVFVPKLVDKPNAILGLEESLQQEGIHEQHLSTQFPYKLSQGMGVGGPVTRNSYPNPYEPELAELKFTQEQLSLCKEQLPKGFQHATLTWVDTVKGLNELAATLDGVSEFAIDLEQHNYRTFQGFVCLMQISTRNADYLVDTLELRSHMHVLNSSFTNPKIVKVMHGSDCDILWLQRDFGLYIVNLFDTGQATRLLNYSSFSLAYLLKRYCKVETNKKYQTADWRIRPLPSDMVKYARQDTHYLLYIYDKLRNELLSNSKAALLSVLNSSRDICRRRYEKELFTEMSYHAALVKFSGAALTSAQLDVFRQLYMWRDRIARAEDESVRFVLPTHMMITIATTIPRDPQSLLQCCNPVPKIVRRESKNLLNIIEYAIKGQTHPSLLDSSTPMKRSRQILDEMDTSSPSSTPQPIRTTLSSPILTTSELYQAAGWIENVDLDASQLQFPNSTSQTYTKPHTPIKLSVKPSSTLFGPVPKQPTEIRSSSQLFGNLQLPGHVFSPQATPKQPTVRFSSPVEQQYDAEVPSSTLDPMSTSPGENNTSPFGEDKVPKSLNEIYKLSKKNGKRNKQKKKLRDEGSSVPTNDVIIGDDLSSTSQPPEEPAAFMKKIGWRL